ncbi:MAG TPA: hypothetical protein VEQ40_01180, partial [Pyrinomonadaceae bacterium]|nr:hypothetical protein [Pyrinomonadaceae bacterium]
MPDDRETRDRVRALVRDVLNNALPAEDEAATGGDASSSAPERTAAPSASPTPSASSTQSRFINIAPEQPAGKEAEAPFTRDESSKTVITETDVHDLAEGSRLRIAEGARLTPL